MVFVSFKISKRRGKAGREAKAEGGMLQQKTAGKNKNTGKYARDSVWKRGKALKVDL